MPSRVSQSVLVLISVTALAVSGSTAAAQSTEHSISDSASAASAERSPFADDSPPPTPDQLTFISDRLGPAADELARAHAAAQQPGEMRAVALPIAGAAIAAAAWCASGAVGSVPPSIFDDIVNGGEGTPYVRNAIIGCIVGNVGSWAWKVLPGWAKQRTIEAVAAFIINYVR